MDTTDAPQIIEHIQKGVSFTPYDVKWIPFSSRFVGLGIHPNAKGAINVYQLNQGMLDVLAEIKTEAGVKCGTFGASSVEERHLATGDHKGKLTVLDLENASRPVFSVQAHGSIINAIDGIGGIDGYGAPELVTGGRDGCVRLWDTRIQTPVLALVPEANSNQTTTSPGSGIPAHPNNTRDCWSVSFGNSYNEQERCIVAGYDNGDIKIYDLRAGAVRYETNVGNGVTGVEFDRKDIEMNKLVVTTLESKYRLFDLRTPPHPTEGAACLTERAHKATVWWAHHLPQNRDIYMTGGGNGGLNLYKYYYPAQRSKMGPDNLPVGVMGSIELLNSKVITSQPIVAMDWSPDYEGLAVCAALDQTLRCYIVTKLNKY